MTDRPILFSGPMVRALLAGTKTQTRRTLKFQPAPGISIIRKTIRPIDGSPYHSFERRSVYGNYAGELDIRIKRGDRLWVKENHAIVPRTAYRMSEGVQQTLRPDDDHDAAVYAAEWDRSKPGRWRPSIHMPRWASRLTLTVTDVRVEKLHDITEADAIAEGIEDVTRVVAPGDLSLRFWKRYRDGGWNGYVDTAVGSYASLWTEINGPGTWEANPFVVAYTFTVERGNIDQIGRAA
ncbi:hypothetical protein [Rhizobium sp. MHM7A]|uniref:hypothetical protein n=1 Tax=Rhizobium sp. MHM7A TaxID=2583233 RepID=UPI0011073212|nr:hypothetical protein [Rhizobium sp. MHM7A]TLX12098.1 hypothetical protein FFR93_16135 [Rhizobium sp. MHM7A]